MPTVATHPPTAHNLALQVLGVHYQPKEISPKTGNFAWILRASFDYTSVLDSMPN